jgi:hypothetical protein
MGTPEPYQPDGNTVNRSRLAMEIAKWTDRMIDLEIGVDAAREAVDRSVAEFRVAVRERDRAVVHLAQLVGWRGEIASFANSVASDVGPEIGQWVAQETEARG